MGNANGRYIDISNSDWFVFRGHTLNEAYRQIYSKNSCIFAGGIVADNEPDNIYLIFEKDDHPAELILLRLDEAQAIVSCLSNASWMIAINNHPTSDERKNG